MQFAVKLRKWTPADRFAYFGFSHSGRRGDVRVGLAGVASSGPAYAVDFVPDGMRPPYVNRREYPSLIRALIVESCRPAAPPAGKPALLELARVLSKDGG